MSNHIDAIHAKGQETDASFEFYYETLRPHLLKYATAICRDRLRRVDTHLVIEMVDDLLMDMGTYEGRSPFSVWVNSYFKYRCLAEMRYRQNKLGEALTEDPVWEDSKTDTALTLAAVQQSLSTRQQAVVQARLEGYTAAEIAAQLGLSERGVYWIWESVLEDLQTLHQ